MVLFIVVKTINVAERIPTRDIPWIWRKGINRLINLNVHYRDSANSMMMMTIASYV